MERANNYEKKNLVTLLESFYQESNALYYEVQLAVTQATTPSNDYKTKECDGEVEAGLLERQQHLTDQAKLLYKQLPLQMKEEVQYRMELVQTEMDKLRVSKSQRNTTHSAREKKGWGGVSEVRLWLQSVEQRMEETQSFTTTTSAQHLQHALIQQRAIQADIECEGGKLFTILHKHSQENHSVDQSRRKVLVDSLERRWHSLWIKSLEYLYTFEQALVSEDPKLTGSDTDSDTDTTEPLPKRRRLFCSEFFPLTEDILQETDNFSETSDTIPFPDNEYESIMETQKLDETSFEPIYLNGIHSDNQPYPVTDSDVEYCNQKGNKVSNRSTMVGDNYGVKNLKDEGWCVGRADTLVHDVGYSSGESSVNEKGLQTPESDKSNFKPAFLRQSTSVEPVPVTSYYKMTPLDDAGQTNVDSPRPLNSVVALGLNNVDIVAGCGSKTVDSPGIPDLQHKIVEQKHLQEILCLLDEPVNISDLPGKINDQVHGGKLRYGMKDGTTWGPLTHSDNGWKSISYHSVCLNDDKDSCDASSELSDGDSEFEHKYPEITVSSLAPNFSQNIPKSTSTPFGSLKRSRSKHKKCLSLQGSPHELSNSEPEGAMMSLSMTSRYSNLEPSMSHCSRKKLKARHVPRSTEPNSNHKLVEADLQELIKGLKKNLHRLVNSISHSECNSYDAGTSTGSLECSYESLHNLDDTISFFKNLHKKLLDEQSRLLVAATLISNANDNILLPKLCGDDHSRVHDDVQQLCSYCSVAIQNMQHHIDQLVEVRNHWVSTSQELQKKLNFLHSQLCLLGQNTDAHDQLNVCNSQHQHSLEAMTSALQECEIRLNRLDTLYNTLVSTFAAPSQDASLFSELSAVSTEAKLSKADSFCPTNKSVSFHMELYTFRVQLDALKQQMENEGVSPVKSHNRRKHVKSSVKKIRTGLPNMSCKRQSKEEKLQKSYPSKRNAGLWLGRLGRIMRASWPLHACMLVLMCLGVWLLPPVCTPDSNNWSGAWGPQLHYVGGPPPS